jgi:hypothetical protein
MSYITAQVFGGFLGIILSRSIYDCGGPIYA